MTKKDRIKPDDLTTMKEFSERKGMSRAEYTQLLYTVRVLQKKQKITNQMIGKRKFYINKELNVIYKALRDINPIKE